MTFTAERIKRVIERYHQRLQEYREALNRLNVYPVPDGDTGTNMTLTMGSVVASVEAASSMEDVAQAIAHGSLMGARGNSGVILSQILRGLADAFCHSEEVGASELALALDRASDAAYRAVLRPVEGTILTVLREAAEAAAESGGAAGEDVPGLLDRVYRRAEEALERTPELLPVLKQAGVVDAGGAGLLLLLAAFLEEATGREVIPPEAVFAASAAMVVEPSEAPSVADLRYEVMYFLDAPNEAMERFRDTWMGVGDSIVVVGGDGTWNCHIHTDHIGAAIEAGITAGRPYQIKVTDLLEQAAAEALHAESGSPAPASFQPLPEFAAAPIGVVPVVVGEGLVAAFRQLGAQGVVSGGQTMNPSTQDLLEVVEAVPAEKVIVLPNNKNIVPVARQLDALTEKEVLVVPTTSVPQGLAAMVAFVPAGEDDRVVDAMAGAAHSVTTGEVTRAVRAATTEAGAVQEGDWLGLRDGVIAVVRSDPGEALRALLGALVDEESELVTMLVGADARAEDTEAALAWVAKHHPEVEVEVTDGGQPLYPYLLSVE